MTTLKAPAGSGGVLNASPLRLAGISLGYLMVLLDSTILNVALPDISSSLGGSVAGQQWTVNAYTVAFAALLLSSGAFSDRFGAARVFRFGIISFAVVSLLAALSPTLWVLILLRGLQGAAAAAIPASTLALIGQLYPEPVARAKAVGLWAALTGIGFASGPLLGGVLVDVAGWRLIFLINLPLALLGLVLTGSLGLNSPTGARPIDWRSQLAAIVFLGLLTDTVIEVSGEPAAAILPAVGAVIALVALIVAERRSGAPAFPGVLLKIPTINTALLAGLSVQFAMAGALFVLGLHFLEYRHFSPALAGLAFLPMTIAPPLIGPLVGRLIGRYGNRRPALAGVSLSTAGNLIMGVAVLMDAPYSVLVVGLFVAGLGLPFTLVPLTSQIVGAAPAGTGGVVGGLFNAARQMGGSLGVAVMGGILAAFGAGRGAGTALLVAAAVSAISLTALALRSE
jgi:DHA2 family methylenomycin A resistance protein-like MFS transporter